MKRVLTIVAAALALGGITAPLSAASSVSGVLLERSEIEQAFGRLGFVYDEDAGDVSISQRQLVVFAVVCTNSATFASFSVTRGVDITVADEGIYVFGFNGDETTRGRPVVPGDPCPGRRSSGTVVTTQFTSVTSEYVAAWNGFHRGVEADFLG